MPFRDPDYEDLQRDCDIFPAYCDYLYGPDKRLEVTQEPGLHPQIYPVHNWQAFVAPIHYTNSMPSRTLSYQMVNGVEEPRNPSARRQSHRQEALRGPGLSRKSNGSSGPGFDVRLRMGSPASQLLPPQGVARRFSREDMARRKILHASQQRSMPAPAAPQQQPMRMTRQQTQVKNAPTLFPVSQAKPFFLRSSSTTDVDEHLAQPSSARKNGMLSPSASPAPTPAQPAHHPLQNAPILPPNPFQSSPSAVPTPAPAATQNPQEQIPILRPSDMVNNPRYRCIDLNKRKAFYGLLSDRWNIAQSQTINQATKAKVIAEIQQISLSVNKNLPDLERVAQMQKQRQAELAQQAQTGQMQQSPMAQQMQAHNMQQAGPTQQMQQSGQMHLPPFLTSSPGQASRQATPLPQYNTQKSPHQQASLPQFSAPQAYQQPAYPPQQLPLIAHPSPSQQPLLTRPSPGQAYEQNLQQMQAQHPNSSQGHQQQPQSAPQVLHSPSSNISRTQTSPPRPVPAQAAAQLRANIDRHMPQVWECLQLIDKRYQPTEPEDIERKQRAHDWLESFKKSLPLEAHGYMHLVVSRMCAAQQAGRDPLSALGMPISQQEGGQ